MTSVAAVPLAKRFDKVRQEDAGEGTEGASESSSSWPACAGAAPWQDGCSESPCPPPKSQCTKHRTCAVTKTTSAIAARERSSGLKVIWRKRISIILHTLTVSAQAFQCRIRK